MISVVVPIDKVDACFEPGGFSGYWEKFGKYSSKWNDGHLLVSTHHDPEFVGFEIDDWEERGLATVQSGRWVDMCVVDQTGGPTLPCDWLEWDPRNKCVWLKGADKGTVVGPPDTAPAAKAVHIPAKALEQAEVKLPKAGPWWKFWDR
jgi:hypothetical protein